MRRGDDRDERRRRSASLAMDSSLQTLLEGKIDFEGQKLVETLVRIVLISSTILAFFSGLVLQSLQVTFGILGLSTALLCLVVVPPWPMYNKHPVKWLPVVKIGKKD